MTDEQDGNENELDRVVDASLSAHTALYDELAALGITDVTVMVWHGERVTLDVTPDEAEHVYRSVAEKLSLTADADSSAVDAELEQRYEALYALAYDALA